MPVRTFQTPGALPTALGADAYARIIELVRLQTGQDFSMYKPGLLRRRIHAGMRTHGLESMAAYVEHLERYPSDVDGLGRNLLIGISAFFRDPEGFEALRAVFTERITRTPREHVVRAWVPGCSTGEEAYSVAMVLCESLEAAGSTAGVQVYATDVDPDAVDVARRGVYPSVIAADVSPARLARFFARDEKGYRVRDELRELVVFAPQDLVADPPIARLDLISCRNVLIYFDADLQQQVVATFHYALAPEGVLFLGSSEGASPELFSPLDMRWRVFRRISLPEGRTVFSLPQRTLLEAKRWRTAGPRGNGPARRMDRAVFSSLVPPAVVVDAENEVVRLYGDVDVFLAQRPPSEAHLRALLPAELLADVEALLCRVRAERREVDSRDVAVTHGAVSLRVDLRAVPLADPEVPGRLVVVAFENVREHAAGEPRPERAPASADEAALEDYRRTTMSLSAANDVLQAANDELQGLNEELGTAQEELHLLNEELQASNAELERRLVALGRANDDLDNLLSVSDIAAAFIDRELRMRRFTGRLREVLGLADSDIGKAVEVVAPAFRGVALDAEVREVLRTLVRRTATVSLPAGASYALCIAPYRTAEKSIEGVVLTLSLREEVQLLEPGAGR